MVPQWNTDGTWAKKRWEVTSLSCLCFTAVTTVLCETWMPKTTTIALQRTVERRAKHRAHVELKEGPGMWNPYVLREKNSYGYSRAEKKAYCYNKIYSRYWEHISLFKEKTRKEKPRINNLLFALSRSVTEMFSQCNYLWLPPGHSWVSTESFFPRNCLKLCSDSNVY